MAPEMIFCPAGERFATALLDWLFEKKEELPGMLVVVPTAQSGRRVRLGLAERGAVLAPKVMVAGKFLGGVDGVAPAVEVLAWGMVLEGIEDWGKYEVLFPEAPAGGEAGWSLGLARSFAELRRELQEVGDTIGTAARRVEALERERWEILAGFEREVEGILADWGGVSRSVRVAAGEIFMPSGVEQVVIAGVLDLPMVVRRFLEGASQRVWVFCPRKDAEGVDAWGCPGETEREIRWPERGSVTLTGDAGQQAEVAVRKVSEGGFGSAEVALGTADEEVAPELVRAFGRAGWVIHDPGGSRPSSMVGFLRAWRRYLGRAEVATAVDLLSFEEGRRMISGYGAEAVEGISRLRDRHLVREVDEVGRARELLRVEAEGANERGRVRLETQVEEAGFAEEVLRELNQWRGRFWREGFHAAMKGLLARIDWEDRFGVGDWLAETAEVAGKVNRSASVWVELLLADLGRVSDEVPVGRVLDVQGWLELLHDAGRHLVVCGMNEGRVPTRASNDPWLPERTRRGLGLSTQESRAARDGYLLRALIEMRAEDGWVDLIVGKTSAGGDVLLPSRVLLTAKGRDLAERVKVLFAEVESPEAAIRYVLEDEWKWRPRVGGTKERLSATAIAKYLACPFRFYLEQVCGMQRAEPERVEWNHRDFGSVMHEVFELWGRDEEARDFCEEGKIREWVVGSLEGLVERRFGVKVPLAISLQVEAMKLRLGWFAREQAAMRKDGWRVVEVEKEFLIEVAGMEVTGKIDRVDQNEKGQVRVLDYKTSREAKKVEAEHLRKGRADEPIHLAGEEVRTLDGRIWKNVQVALYAEALGGVDEVGYFSLGESSESVVLDLWGGFDEDLQRSAMACVGWVVRQVRAGVFWPPAERVDYDDFEELGFGREFESAFAWAAKEGENE